MRPTQNPEAIPDYASRERELLAYLQEAERAATAGEIGDMLKMQAKVHHILMGDETGIIWRGATAEKGVQGLGTRLYPH